MYNTKQFGAYLASKRRQTHMSQSDLAIRLNLTRQSISHYETGQSFPDISIIIQFAAIFDITIDELVKSGLPP